MAGPPDPKKVAALQIANAKARWLSNQDPDCQLTSRAPDLSRPSTPASSVTVSSANAVAAPSDRTEPTSSYLAAQNQPFALDDLITTVKEYLSTSCVHYNAYYALYTLKFSKAMNIFGANKFMSGPEGRDVLRSGTYFYKCAQKAEMPGGIFRWLEGLPMGATFEYPSSHIDRVIEQLIPQDI